MARNSAALSRPPVAHRQAKWEPVSRPDGALDSNGARSDAKPVPTFADRALLPSAPAGGYVDDVTELLGVAVEFERRRGRGAQTNASGRYELLALPLPHRCRYAPGYPGTSGIYEAAGV